MRQIIVIVAVFFCFSFAVAAPDVSLTGTVVDSSKAGINHARVSLVKYPAMVSMTDDMGAFTMLSTAALNRSNNNGRVAAAPYINNNRIVFTTSTIGQAVMVDIFALNGARVYASRLTDLAPGSHSALLPKTRTGIYFVRIAVGNEKHVLKMAAVVHGSVGVAASRGSQSSPSVVLGKKTAGAIVDTLIVVAPGYKHAIKAIANYTETGIQIELGNSNPWRPNYYPEKATGMVHLMANGYNFEMGQPDPNIGGNGMSINEQAVHTVSFTYDFWMDTIEVTQKLYSTLMAAAYSDFVTPPWQSKYGLGDSYPAYYVSWADAALYCNARSKRDGFDSVYSYTSRLNKPGEYTCELAGVSALLSKNGYRLPTEAEWEYAYKGGTFTDYYWVQNYNPYPANLLDTMEIGSYEIWKVNSWDKGAGVSGYGTQTVSKKINNNYCIYDMAGNVSEWCHEYWSDSYSYDTVTNPVGQATGLQGAHSIRGGNWGSDQIYLRAQNRKFYAPDSSCFFQGFRCVRPIVQ